MGEEGNPLDPGKSRALGRNEENRRLGQGHPQTRKHLGFGERIKRAGCVITHQDIWPGEQRPRQAQPLAQ